MPPKKQPPAHEDPRLPKIPARLAGWRWESQQDGTVRLAQPIEGWATDWAPFLLADQAIAEAIQIEDRDAAALAAESPPRPTPATTWQSGPDAQGVYRRPPHMAEYTSFPPRDLVDGRWQPRETYEATDLQELKDSIREHGVTTPLLVLINEYGEPELIAGHRRKRATLELDGRDVPCRVLEVTAAQAYEIAIVENDQRSDLNDLERGRAYERLIAELGISESKLAERLGRPRAYIQQRRLIAAAAPELQRAVASGELGFTQARAICLGSGGDHKVQATVTTQALADIRADRPEPAGRLQETAERTVRERYEVKLKQLGWKRQQFYGYGKTLYLFWAPTAKPVVWSSGEILATVQEGRRPPEGLGPSPLSNEDRAALELAGWRVFIEGYCAPWAIIERSKELAYGDAGDLVVQIAAAREALASLTTRFEAKDWQVEPSKNARGRLKLVPPMPEPEGKKKPKRPAPVDASFVDAEKILSEVEQGTWKPVKVASSGSGQRYTCKRCGLKMSWDQANYIDSDYHCAECKTAILAEWEAQKAQFATIVERDMGTWLDQAPGLASFVLSLKAGEPIAAGNQPGPALRRVFVDWMWNHRTRFKLTEQPAEPAPATAVAPPDRATLETALAGLEARCAAGELDAADVGALDDLAEVLDEIGLDEDTRAAFVARIGELMAQIGAEVEA